METIEFIIACPAPVSVRTLPKMLEEAIIKNNMAVILAVAIKLSVKIRHVSLR